MTGPVHRRSLAAAPTLLNRSQGRVSGAETMTIIRNDILYALNKPDDFIMAIVEFLSSDSHRVHYVRCPFQREPGFEGASVNYDFDELLKNDTNINADPV